MYASLAADHGVPLADIRRMSPRQVHDIYNHERNKDGTLRAPEAHNTVDRLAQLAALISSGMVRATPEQLAELKRRIADGHGGGPAGEHPQSA